MSFSGAYNERGANAFSFVKLIGSLEKKDRNNSGYVDKRSLISNLHFTEEELEKQISHNYDMGLVRSNESYIFLTKDGKNIYERIKGNDKTQ